MTPRQKENLEFLQMHAERGKRFTQAFGYDGAGRMCKLFECILELVEQIKNEPKPTIRSTDP